LAIDISSACLKKQQSGLEPLVTPGPPLNQLMPPFSHGCNLRFWRYRAEICLVGLPNLTIFSHFQFYQNNKALQYKTSDKDIERFALKKQ